MRNIILITILLIVGCTSPAAYTAFLPVDVQQWSAEDEANFEIQLEGSPTPHQLYVFVRTTKAHRYDTQRLPLEITQHWQHIKATRIDTIQVEITDETGNFTGKGLHHRDILTPLGEIHCTDSLKGTISIRPYTPLPVHGISHIGVELR